MTATSAGEERRTGTNDIAIGPANSVIQELFAVGFDLASCAEMVDGPAAARVGKAVHDIDTVIAHIRSAVFAQLREGDGTLDSPIPSSKDGVDELIDQISTVAGRVGELAQTVPVEGPATLHLLDAMHTLHRARIDLASELPRPGPAARHIRRPMPGGVEYRTFDPRHPPATLADHLYGQETNMPTKRATKPKTVPVFFTLPAAVEANEVALCGDFNDWSTDDIHLTRGGNGRWEATVDLAPGRSYRYRYLLDRQRWENAWNAEQYAPNPYGGDDSVIIVLD